MGFADIIGQDGAVRFLQRLVTHRRVPSALLFQGPPEVGKRTTAIMLAQALNCARDDGDACGACPPCRKIAADVHPDVEVVAPEGRQIRIDQVRGVAERLALIPYEARRRVVILDDADCMNLQAANAFLKTLEEPPADTLLVLVAARVSWLPETIVSRCLPVRFGPLPAETVRRLLGEAGLSGAELEFAVRYAQGRLRPGLRRNAGRWMVLRDEVFGALEGLDAVGYDEASGRIQKWSASEDYDFVLECLEAWFHDVRLLAAGGPAERLVNPDREAALRRWSHRLSPERLEAGYRELLAVREGQQLHLNKTLALEGLWFTLKQGALPGPAPGP